MLSFPFWLAVINLLIVVVVGLRLVLGSRSIGRLIDIEPLHGDDLPRVSVIVAARNEQRDIEEALQSLLQLDYPNLQLIVVNDRSTDKTGEILDRMTSANRQINLVHLKDLPDGWLGKNNALQRGADQADGEFLLFTDADVVMQKDVVRRAVGYMNQRKIDHLPMTPDVDMPTWFLESFVITFMIFFFTYFRPWSAGNPRSSAHVGVGAFNMIRTEVYRDMGGHHEIAMRPDDDVKLGKLVKKHGYRQEMLFGTGLVSVPWYASVAEVIEGLMKNAFSGVEYNPLMVIGSSFAALLFNVLPFGAIFFTSGATRIMYAIVVLLLLLLYCDCAWNAKTRLWCAIGFPFTVLLFVYIQWRSMFLTLWQGGIYWRDTFYPLDQLRANKV